MRMYAAGGSCFAVGIAGHRRATSFSVHLQRRRFQSSTAFSSRLEALLDCSDPDLFDWIFGVTPPPVQHDHDVMRLLRDFCIARQIIRQAQQQSRT